jgi:tetratricopeptide (TPR) repeat protein
MIRYRRQVLFVLIAVAAGCAAKAPSSPTTEPPTNLAATQAGGAADDKAYLSLDQITPVPHLAAPATQPTGRVPLDALMEFARARDAMLQGEHYTAITQLEKAIVLDPDSYLLQYELGKAYLALAGMEDRSIAAFERAAQLDPNHLDLQEKLGRQYLAGGDMPRSLEHLRLALQTSDYTTDDGQAAVADFFLARALQQAGYDRAALDSYHSLVQRLRTPTLQIRQDQELAYLVDRPELLYAEIGELYEKHGEFASALAAYEPAAESDPDNFDLQARVARMLASTGQRDEALAKAADLIVAHHAMPPSLLLLADVCQRLRLPGGTIAALTKLHADRPADSAVFFALTDSLIAQNRQADAENLLADAWEKSPGDTQIVRRLFAVYRQHADPVPAARLLTIALARNPDSLANLAPLWIQLLQPGRNNRLKLQSVQLMDLPRDVEAARDFWISQLASFGHRDALARSAMQRSIQFVPPFAPAFRASLAQTWAQETLSSQQKIEACHQLSVLALAGGNLSLASELDGLSLLYQKQPAAAADALSKAIAQSNQGGQKPSPDLLMAYARSVHKPGKDEQFEQLLWNLINEYPLYGESYATLFDYYYGDADVGQFSQAMKVLSTWLATDPQSISARVLDASLNNRVGSTAQAQTKLQRLFDEDPDNLEVLQAMEVCYIQANQLGDFVRILETYHAQHPQDTVIAERLVGSYFEQKKTDDAERVLDQTCAADAGDADLLYSLTQLYHLIGQNSTSEQLLQQVIHLDPTHAGASNDLGYEWADEGKNLPQAETLIRVAVAAEPDNESFLDSLGWVMYKQGKFDEARKYLEQAVGPADLPDPVVLNHLGDALYRLSKSTDAAKVWQRSLKGIGDGDVDRDDLKQLRPQLQQKIKAVQSNQPADVAPAP